MFPVDFPLNILNQSIDYLTSSHLHCRSSAKSHPSRDVFAFHSVECSAFAALAVRAMGQNGRRSHRGLYAVKDVIFWHFWGPNFCLNSYLASIFFVLNVGTLAGNHWKQPWNRLPSAQHTWSAAWDGWASVPSVLRETADSGLVVVLSVENLAKFPVKSPSGWDRGHKTSAFWRIFGMTKITYIMVFVQYFPLC